MTRVCGRSVVSLCAVQVLVSQVAAHYTAGYFNVLARRLAGTTGDAMTNYRVWMAVDESSLCATASPCHPSARALELVGSQGAGSTGLSSSAPTSAWLACTTPQSSPRSAVSSSSSTVIMQKRRAPCQTRPGLPQSMLCAATSLSAVDAVSGLAVISCGRIVFGYHSSTSPTTARIVSCRYNALLAGKESSAG